MRVRRLALLMALGAVLLAASSRGVAETTSPGPTATAIQARWKKQKLDFAYQGLTTKYSCEGAKEKIGALLRYFGARPDSIRLRAHGCAGGPYRPSSVVQLQMEFETLAPATDGGTGDTVPAQWIVRDLFGKTKVSRNAPSYIGRGDCELVQSFVVSILPVFSHEIVRNLTKCIPKELAGSAPNLSVRVLVPAS